ncbi:MAG TPA: hypothetical protein PKC69_15070 [Chitinophagaceae bacterium]|nr:hypothetical protein [Chitinophagaceae bacterium]
MYDKLYQYLSASKRLDLPGIGTLVLQRIPASFDYSNRVVLPPAYNLVLQHGNTAVPPSFISWLSHIQHTTEAEAIAHFESFAGDMKNDIMNGRKTEWDGVGIFSKGLAGEIHFQPAVKFQLAGEPVAAIKVVREHAEHTIRVGEDEKTATEMREMLQPARENKSNSWLAAIILLLLALIYIGYYFSVKGVAPAAAGNQQKITPAAPAVHKQ